MINENFLYVAIVMVLIAFMGSAVIIVGSKQHTEALKQEVILATMDCRK